MDDSRVNLQAAYLLHQQSYHESSTLTDFLTPDFGRVRAVAKGVRSARSGRRSLLQPFRPLLISWVGGRSLKTLTTVESSGLPHVLDDTAQACAFYATEIVLRLVAEGDSHITVFAAYDSVLRELASSEPEVPLRTFEVALLQSLGWWPDFSVVRRGDANAVAEASVDVSFDPSESCLVHANSQNSGLIPLSFSALQLLRSADSASLQSASELPDSTLALRQVKHVTRTLIAAHLHGRPLKSRQVFRDMQALAGRSELTRSDAQSANEDSANEQSTNVQSTNVQSTNEQDN